MSRSYVVPLLAKCGKEAVVSNLCPVAVKEHIVRVQIRVHDAAAVQLRNPGPAPS
jgi:hypothetical protein